MNNINEGGDSQSFVNESQGLSHKSKNFNDQETPYDKLSQNFYPTQQVEKLQIETGKDSQEFQYTIEATQIREINSAQKEFYQGLMEQGGKNNPDQD